MSILRMTALMGALMAGSVAQAQDSTIDFELFRPYSDAYGYLSMPSAATLGHLQVGGAFWFNYSNDPVILVYDGNRIAPDQTRSMGMLETAWSMAAMPEISTWVSG